MDKEQAQQELLRQRNTALHIAAFQRYKRSLELLIKYGANIKQTNRAGKSALDVSVSRFDQDGALILLKAGP